MCSYAPLGLLVLLVVIPDSIGFNVGAPASTCVDMTPRHAKFVAQESTSPYSLEVTEEAAMGSDTLKVCVTGREFKGILLQMRAVGDTAPVGTFFGMMADDTKTMNCSADDDTVTHSNATIKPSPSCFYWKAPDNVTPQDVHFVATIVEKGPMFWVNVTSDVINLQSVLSTSGPQDVTTATWTTTTHSSGADSSGVTFTTYAWCSLLAIVARLRK